MRHKYSTIFTPNEVVELEPRVLAYLVSQLQPWSLLESDIDVKGKAYEEIVGSNLRGDRGEFFTPRNICGMAVAMLDPGPNDLVLDPACGTGGFLTIAMNQVIEKIRASEKTKWRVAGNPSEGEIAELHRKIRDYADQRIVGIDINPNLVKASKMNMVMNNDGAGGLYQANSLARPVTWRETLRDRELRRYSRSPVHESRPSARKSWWTIRRSWSSTSSLTCGTTTRTKTTIVSESLGNFRIPSHRRSCSSSVASSSLRAGYRPHGNRTTGRDT